MEPHRPNVNRDRFFWDMDGSLAAWRSVDALDELLEKNFFLDLSPQSMIVMALRYFLKIGYGEHFILSAYLTDSLYALDEKNAWLDMFVPEIDKSHRIFVPCNKPKALCVPGGLAKTDRLIDDYTTNLLPWRADGGVGIKVLNGINHTRKTWKGTCIHVKDSVQEIVRTIVCSD